MKGRASRGFQALVLIFGTALTCIANRQYGITPCTIRGPSMEPTLREGETYLVDSWNKTFSRGEIVVLNDGMKGEVIKRIVGLPGETIRIDGTVKVNNRPLKEPYLEPWMRTYTAHKRPSEVYRLGKDEFFVMGDNRVVSEDSRDYGPINEWQVRGKVRTMAKSGS